MNPSITFTTEETRPDGSMPFLDTLITPQEDGTLTTHVYRKPTNTDLYHQWDSHHNLACKNSMINTFTHRAKTACSNSQLLEKELHHLLEVLTRCRYTKSTTDKVLQKQEDRRIENRRDQGRNSKQTLKKFHIIVPHHKAYMKATRSFVANMVSRCILKEGIL